MTTSMLSAHRRAAATAGRLLARPQRVCTAAAAGIHTLRLPVSRAVEVYIPSGYWVEQPAPLVVLFHGAGGRAAHGLSLLQPLAEAVGLILLAPSSQGTTWDVIRGRYGPDVELLDSALEQVFHLCAIDATRIAIGGFSDGASYALSLGLGNGHLFSHILAFSPGFFIAPSRPAPRPQIFVAHGTADEVLPIACCSRRLVPALERAGYAVRYREFDGPHTLPPAIACEAVTGFLDTRYPPGGLH